MTIHSRISCIVLFVVSGLAYGRNTNPVLSDADEHKGEGAVLLSEHGRGWTTEQLDVACSALRTKLEADDPAQSTAAWTMASAVTSDAQLSAALRLRVFETMLKAACARGDKASEILTIVERCLDRWEANRRGRPNSPAADQGPFVFEADAVRAFLQPDAPEVWARTFSADARFPVLLARAYLVRPYATFDGFGPRDQPKGRDLIGLLASVSGIENHRESFASTVVSMTTEMVLDARLCRWLSIKEVDSLRDRARMAADSMIAIGPMSANSGPGRLPYSVIFALASRGDTATRPIILRLIEQVETLNADDRGATTFRPRMAAQLRGYLRMIEALHGADGLVALVSSPAPNDCEDAWLKSWALQEAVSVGVDRAALREAVVKYCQAVLDQWDRANWKYPLPPPSVTCARNLRDQALALDVLVKDDLDGFPAPIERPER